MISSRYPGFSKKFILLIIIACALIIPIFFFSSSVLAADTQVGYAAWSEYRCKDYGPIWYTSSVGYMFNLDNGENLDLYKTTNGGTSWSLDSELWTGSISCYSVYPSWKTPGYESSSIINIVLIDSDVDGAHYVEFDCSDDSNSTYQIFSDTVYISAIKPIDVTLTLSTGGTYYTAFYFYYASLTVDYKFYSSTDPLSSWTSRSNPYEITTDYMRIHYGSEADPDDIYAIYKDAHTFSLKVYDASGDSWSEPQDNIYTEGSNYSNSWGSDVRASDGHIIFTCGYDSTSSSEIVVYDISPSAVSAKTEIITSDYGNTPSVLVNIDDYIYVAYEANQDVYWTYSDDDGTTWASATQVNDTSLSLFRVCMGYTSSIGVGWVQPCWVAQTDWYYVNYTNKTEIIADLVTTPSVNTDAATDIGVETATLNGEITDTGGEDVIQRGFVWGTTSLGDPGNTSPTVTAYDDAYIQHGTFGTGTFDYDLGEFDYSETYYFRAFAGNLTAGWSYGDEETFDTLDPGPPTVTTDAVTSIAGITAILNGEVTDIGDSVITQRGFVWGESTLGDPGDTAPSATAYDSYWTESGSFGTQEFDYSSGVFVAGTTYYVRACAKNNSGPGVWAYGSEVSFTTLTGAPSIVTGEATGITDASALLHGDLIDFDEFAGAYVYVSFEYANDDYYTLHSDYDRETEEIAWLVDYGITSISIEIDGLAESTTYHYRAKCRYGTDYVYGADESFTTSLEYPTRTPDVISVHAYKDLLETDDCLFVILADIPYSTIPDIPVSRAYFWSLLDSGTELGWNTGYAMNDKGYNYNIYSLYFDATTGIEWGNVTDYTLNLWGNPDIFSGEVPSYGIADDSKYGIYEEAWVDATDYNEALADGLLAIAKTLEQEWQIVLLDEQDTRTVLSSNGEKLFRNAIPGVQSMAPSIFFIQLADIDTSLRDWGTSKSDEYKERLLGEDGEPGGGDDNWALWGFVGIADWINVPFLLLVAIVCLGVCVVAIWQAMKRFGTAVPGYIASIAIILCFGMLVMGLTAIGIIGLGLVIVVGWLLFMRRG